MLKDNAVNNLKRRDSFKYALAGEGVLIGMITGALISVFRLMLTAGDSVRNRMVLLATGRSRGVGLPESIEPIWLAAAAVCLILITAVITLLLSIEPDISGSGIPQVEGELKGRKDMNWLRVIIAKMTGCALAISGGLALGREGPSIQLGAMVGKGFARLRHRMLTEERLLITCGAGAGLSAAFGAPLAGAIFALEELHRNFSAEVLLSTMAASVSAEFIAANVFGLTPVFGFNVEHGLPLRYYWAVVIAGIAVGFLGIVYNRTIAFMQDASERIGRLSASAAGWLLRRRAYNISDKHLSIFGSRAAAAGRLGAAFLASYILMIFYPDIPGSGSMLVEEISSGQYDLGQTAAGAAGLLAALLIVKFIFSTMSFGSGSPGGIFLPLLVLGAVTGGLLSRILVIAGFDQNYITAMVVVSMAGFFSAIVRAPVTGVVLITEMTGDFTSLLPLVMSALIAYVIAEVSGTEPIYTQLLNRSMGRPAPAPQAAKRGRNAGTRGNTVRSRSLLIRDRKAVVDADVHVGSYMDGRRVMEFGLPVGTLIVSVVRDGIEIIPDGHTILRGGDLLEILMREGDIADAEALIEERCSTVIVHKS